ncbi:MAG: DUF4224 domain-containing protein [Proteobacteria bacterium]|nr:DUF4224 domain-containing protein [Pseudomonadota bacterium]
MIVLTEKEVRALTGKTYHKAQARALDSMGIFYRLRPDGSLAVLRVHVENPAPPDRLPPEPVLQP